MKFCAKLYPRHSTSISSCHLSNNLRTKSIERLGVRVLCRQTGRVSVSGSPKPAASHRWDPKTYCQGNSHHIPRIHLAHLPPLPVLGHHPCIKKAPPQSLSLSLPLFSFRCHLASFSPNKPLTRGTALAWCPMFRLEPLF
jgi:hypothetical protein